jgi:acyl-CoA reductase-like NAD-dependent aldehyde dehydrogenase
MAKLRQPAERDHEDLLHEVLELAAIAEHPVQVGGDHPAEPARTPITGGSLGAAGAAGSVDAAVERAQAAFAVWRETPAPVSAAT